MVFIKFNQDFSFLAVASTSMAPIGQTGENYEDYTMIPNNSRPESSLRIFSCKEPFQCCFKLSEIKLSIAEMLFSSSLVALVGRPNVDPLDASGSSAVSSLGRTISSPRHLHIINITKNQSESFSEKRISGSLLRPGKAENDVHKICELSFQTAIQSVQMNRHRLIVQLSDDYHSPVKKKNTQKRSLNASSEASSRGQNELYAGGCGKIKIYDLSDMQLLWTIDLPYSTYNPYSLLANSNLYRNNSWDIEKEEFAHVSQSQLNQFHEGISLCVLSPDANCKKRELSLGGQKSISRCFLAYPANSYTGDILIFDASRSSFPRGLNDESKAQSFDNSMKTVNIIQAHKSPITCMAFNSNGTMLATASEKGTVIRVFSVPDGKRLYQFRRGAMSARVGSITFGKSLNNSLSPIQEEDFVCVWSVGSSSSPASNLNASPGGTIHLFKLEMRNSAEVDGNPVSVSGIISAVGSTVSGFSQSILGQSSAVNAGNKSRRVSPGVSYLQAAAQPYLPQTISEILEPVRDFASVRIGSSSSRNVAKDQQNRPFSITPNGSMVMCIGTIKPVDETEVKSHENTPKTANLIVITSSKISRVEDSVIAHCFDLDLENGDGCTFRSSYW